MITGELKSRIDKLWEEFWTGGITNPLTVIEQISFLMFAKLLDIAETRNEKKAQRTNKPFRRIFPDTEGGQALRWKEFKNYGADKMLPHVRDKVFPHFKNVAVEEAKFGEYMKDAQLMINKPTLLVSALNMINELPLTEGDTKGDLYEYLLSKLTTAGINGQFRTPRHIIRLMVELLDPHLEHNEVIGDPACGTGGFLVEVMHYLQRKYTSPEGVIDHEGEKVYSGDLLEPYREHIQTSLIHGFDFDVTMLRIAAMNLLLHGLDAPDIHYQDTLSGSFSDKFPKQSQNFFDIILANPPFKGSLDFEDVHSSLLAQVKTKKTELLFVALILRMLKNGGRSATIVPDGVLFGSSNAHVALRQKLVDNNQLEAVISLPSGVFKPYAGVSTGILIFTKGGKTENVFFYDMQDDGFSLDDKRTQLYDSTFAGDLPECLASWKARDPLKDIARTTKAFFVPVTDIRDKNYDLSLNRYKETVYEEMKYEHPKDILKKLKGLENEIMKDMSELEEML
ncbi:MAG: N-6 DNA methylase [Thermodesulfobacteriota bacterium]